MRTLSQRRWELRQRPERRSLGGGHRVTRRWRPRPPLPPAQLYTSQVFAPPAPAPAPRSLTALLMGDPPPGRSALDRKNEIKLGVQP